MINAVIIDDEEISRKTLANILNEYFPDIKLCGTACTVEEGISAIRKYTPRLVFLDIAMPDGDGFEVLENTRDIPCKTIFITAYHNYAIRAFEFSALHYLLKPINIEELERAINRFSASGTVEFEHERIEILKQGMQDTIKKIALPTNDSILFVELDHIIRCEASHNYTIFYLKNKGTAVMSKSLQNYEKLLTPYNFFRVHDKHLVNLKYVDQYRRGKGGFAVLEDGSEVEISIRKKDDFLHQISIFTGK
ncbi:MAG TPA: LytTR family DNA-binding domain-containing protein [Bacteroidia bacterium]|nr:LytTR family DNA-binding domain-containing protein [Bacteroidia bacterium]